MNRRHFLKEVEFEPSLEELNGGERFNSHETTWVQILALSFADLMTLASSLISLALKCRKCTMELIKCLFLQNLLI